ncbi:MAG: PspA/IM30 family protein [Bdellovibrionales bacterium]|nr:PspA/IM30 family protein [Bdellovibrionales bacterium]
MKRFRLWTTSIAASFDSMLRQIENHEGVVNETIKQIQAAARAKVQHKRVVQDGKRLRHKMLELQKQNSLWHERALRCAASDETRALECLRRKKQIDKEIAELEVQIHEHQLLEEQLTIDLKHVEKNLEDIKRQRNILRTRESRAAALRTVQVSDTELFGEIDHLFERWDEKVTRYEIEGSMVSPLEMEGDGLEEQFLSEEEEAALGKELAELVKSSGEASA